MKKRWWISWYHQDVYGPFTLNMPWWVTGSVGVSGEIFTICAIVRAETPEAAKQVIKSTYDDQPHEIDFRFCTEQEEGWWPPADRFSRAGWMVDA